ncbi:glycosyltransferase family 1 protein, partial [Vibrio parahaemolyticus]|nr:glycosyltransferase family 1 protein [Vibrio parahaemolyticus]
KRFEKKTNVIICGSYISYRIFFKDKKYIVSLESGYNAPKIKFSRKHSKVIMFISDSHSKKWLNKYIKKNSITDILTPYKKTLQGLGFANVLSDERVHSFPWCVDNNIITPFKPINRNTGVLGFGQIGLKTGVYDQREWSINSGLLKSFDYAGSGNQAYKGDDYYSWLRGFDASVVAMSTKDIYNYTVAKYFEVPSQGVLLIAFPSVDLEEFGFRDGVNCLFVNRDNFFERIRHYENNPDLYLDVRSKGIMLIKENHSVEKRLDDLTN